MGYRRVMSIVASSRHPNTTSRDEVATLCGKGDAWVTRGDASRRDASPHLPGVIGPGDACDVKSGTCQPPRARARYPRHRECDVIRVTRHPEHHPEAPPKEHTCAHR